LNQELKDAGTTMVGTVEAAAPVPDSSFHLDGIDYVVHVDRVIKGRMISTDVVHIFSENSPTKFPMQTGKQYLLFVHRNFNDYEVDNCGNSGLMQASNIDSVAKLKQQGRSLDETIAAKPTTAFDAKWGQFLITPAFFTKLVYEGV